LGIIPGGNWPSLAPNNGSLGGNPGMTGKSLCGEEPPISPSWIGLEDLSLDSDCDCCSAELACWALSN